jgi:hypothetical protein
MYIYLAKIKVPKHHAMRVTKSRQRLRTLTPADDPAGRISPEGKSLRHPWYPLDRILGADPKADFDVIAILQLSC